MKNWLGICKEEDAFPMPDSELIDFYNNSELKSSLENAEFVLGIQSYITEEEMNYYDVILPLATVFESPGTFINIENEWQSFVQCCSPHYMSKEGWKILTKLRLVHGSEIGETLDYIDILNEIDSIIRNNKKILDESKKKLSIDKIKKEDFLIRCGGDSSYFTDSIVRRATSLNKVNINKNLVRVNKKTLEQNNIDLSKNKIIIKQGKNKLLVDLVIDENVSNDCVYIINSNKEHYDLLEYFQHLTHDYVKFSNKINKEFDLDEYWEVNYLSIKSAQILNQNDVNKSINQLKGIISLVYVLRQQTAKMKEYMLSAL